MADHDSKDHMENMNSDQNPNYSVFMYIGDSTTQFLPRL